MIEIKDGYEVWPRGKETWSLGFLHTYQITMFVGILISFLTVVWFWKRQKYSWQILQILVIIIVPTSIVGARLWFLIASGDKANWAKFYEFKGLSIHGGVLFSTAAAIWFLSYRKSSVDMRTAIGIILPSILIGQAIGRFGNMDNHEVYGKVVDASSLDWMGPMKKHMYIRNSYDDILHWRTPLFFYESMSSLFGYIVIIWVLLNYNLVKPGVTGALYLLWYGIVRISMEPLRDPVDIMKWGDFPVSMLLAGISIALGLGLLIWWQGFTKPFDKLILAIMPKSILDKVNKKYKMITPLKPVLFTKDKTERKQFYLFGKIVENRVRLWLPDARVEKQSKRKMNNMWSRRS